MSNYSNNLSYCKNCGKQGHTTNSCKTPITSYGVIAFRFNPLIGENEYLMVCRKNSFGFIDFMRGKYSIHNKLYIINMVKQMTTEEKNDLKTLSFDELWRKLWNLSPNSNETVPSTINEKIPTSEEIKNKNYICYKNEEYTSKDKFNILKMGVYTPYVSNVIFPKTTIIIPSEKKNDDYLNEDVVNKINDKRFNFHSGVTSEKYNNLSNTLLPSRTCYYVSSKINFQEKTFVKNYYSLETIINDCDNKTQWEEPEWGFPKGRRNYQEKDYETAIREFSEETGYDNKYLKNIQNIMPFEEIVIGSNYKSYKSKYYLMYINYNDTLRTNIFETDEISKIEWKTYEECLHLIRSYNLEKKRLIINIHQCLSNYSLFM